MGSGFEEFEPPNTGQWGYRVYQGREGVVPEESDGPFVYWSYKGADGVLHVQGDDELAGFIFAWRTPDTDGFPPEYPRRFPDPEGQPGDGHGSDG